MVTDLITKLPGYNKRLPSKTYGGYVSLNEDKHMYYMFIESEIAPKKAPIMFWTNGGPGCSGLMGLFEEFSPYKPVKSGKLIYNKFTWTKFANIVFIEQPIGVGFSWSSKKADYKSNDLLSAKDNLSFILNFFKKYPAYSNNPLYLISESYGGHYIPQWTKQILSYNKKNPSNKLPLKGFMIGNPYVNYTSGTEAQIETYWGHQRIPLHLWNTFKKKKCNKTKKQWKGKKLYACNQLSYKIENAVGKHNPYALSYPLCVSNQQNLLHRVYKTKTKTVKNLYDPCTDKYTGKYLNRKDVQAAIHAKRPPVVWRTCSNISKYRYSDTYNSQVPVINNILNSKELAPLDILIISGTNDSICGTVATQRWIETLDSKPKDIWSQYFVRKEPSGYISKYKANNSSSTLTFATVNGAGHEVPMYKPEAAQYLMNMYINKKL